MFSTPCETLKVSVQCVTPPQPPSVILVTPLTRISHLQTGNVIPFTLSWPGCSNEAVSVLLHIAWQILMLVRSSYLAVIEKITNKMRE